MSPLVSIIIPCFNAERYVAEAIESALAQTYPHKEVMVVDDGSTDGSLEVIRSFDDRIRWVTGANRGACAARNQGVQLAEGQFVQFLDADDLLDPTKVERCLTHLNGRPDTIVYSLHRVESLEPDRVPARQWNRRTGFEEPIRFMLRGDLPTPAPLHRKSIVEAVGGFREDLPCAQDRDFHLRLVLAGVALDLVPEELFTIRRRSGSIGTSSSTRLEQQRAQIAREVYARLASEGRLSDELAAECAAMLTKAARVISRREPRSARQLFREAKRMHRSGGFHLVYSRRLRAIVNLVGPVAAERIAARLRAV